MPDESLSPSLLEKVVYLGAALRSFPQAQQAAETLLELPLTTKRIERITERIGSERVAERDAQVAAWQSLPLLAKLAAPSSVKAPAAVAISCDGGRLQRCDVSADDEKHWREYKAGSLMELETEEHASDPCPQLPAVFLEADRMERLTREIGQVAARTHGAPPGAAPVDGAPVAEPIAPPQTPESVAASNDATPGPRYEPPVVRQRDVCATLGNSDAFGPQLAALAWMLGFAAARLKAFVADGLAWNWTIWERYFKHLQFVPILDFVHALTHVFAAAMAGRDRDTAWPVYVRWIRWIWQGEVVRVIAELAERQRELGAPQADSSDTDPRKIVRDTLTYLQNQQARMNYPAYRRAGLPITSSHMESTIKELNGRIKGSEKFWSGRGGEAVLQLRADLLSDSLPLPAFWASRAAQASGTRSYALAA
jgi:hypothetical protein